VPRISGTFFVARALSLKAEELGMMLITRLAIAATLGLMATPAMAETIGTGTVVGRLLICRTLAAPVASADGSGPDLADVTPGLKRALPRTIQLPAQAIEVAVQGTTISAITDASGAFALNGVPAEQPLTLLAQVPPAGSLVLSGAAPIVSSGQTLDLGTLGLGVCGGAAFVPQAPPASASDTPTDANASAPDAQTDPSTDTPADGS
jgi:hypothetical protein